MKSASEKQNNSSEDGFLTQQEFITKIKATKEPMSQALIQATNRLIDKLKVLQPLELLAGAFCLYIIGKRNSSIPSTSLVALEYLNSLVTSFDYSDKMNHVSGQDLKEVLTLLNDLHNNTILYYMTESVASDKSRTETSIRSEQILWNLAVRHHSYGCHMFERLAKRFAPLDSVLVDKLGFSIQELIDFTHSTVNTIYGALVDNESEAYLSELVTLVDRSAQGPILGLVDKFRLNAQTESEKSILKSVSICLGENRQFIEYFTLTPNVKTALSPN